MEIERLAGRAAADEDDASPVEQVRLTVPTTDDPTLPVWTFRMWTLGFLSCALLSFVNQFFAYRSEPLTISQITIQVAALPIGHFMARVLPERKFRVFGRECSLNPGPFNVKEHVLISIFANAGAAFGGGNAYAIGIITIIKAFYKRNISFVTSLLLIITTQVLGYGWAGLMRKYVVEPAHMWWPASLVQVSLMRAMHEKEKRRMTRGKFFLIALICSFAWYTVPGYLFPTLSAISWVCWVYPKSITMQQIGSGMNGLGVGALTLDWSVVASFLGSPLVSPFFATANVLAGYILLVYVMLPISYWVLNLYNASTFPLFSNDLFTGSGQLYNISAIVNDKFEIDMDAYAQQGKIHLSLFFAISYGLGFATIAATLSHVTLFYGKYGNVPEVQGVIQGQGGRAHEADEEVRRHTQLVVLPPARGVHGRVLGALHHVQGGDSAALVGAPLGLRHGLHLHAPHQCHHRNHKHDARVEHHHGVLPRADHAGKADCQRVLQGVRLHEHEPGRLLPYRLQAWSLHEDPSKIHVPSAVRGDSGGVVSEHGGGMVAADDGAAHLREGQAAGGQSVDVPERPRLLRRVSDLGPGRPAPHLRAPRLLQRAKLVLPGRVGRAVSGLALRQGSAAARGLDQPHQPARHPGGHGYDAAGVGAQLHGVVLRRHGVQLLRVQVPEGVVEAVQLRAVGGHGRRRGHHGGAHLLRAQQRGQSARLVGLQGRVLRPRNLPHRQGRGGGRLSRSLN